MNYEIYKISYYVISLGLLIFSLDLFQNFWVFLVVLLIELLIYFFLAKKFKNYNFVIIPIVLASVALISFAFFKYNLNSHINNYSKHFTKKTYIVQSIEKGGNYIVKNDFNDLFLLKKAVSGYQVGDKLKIYGFLVPSKTEENNYLISFKFPKLNQLKENLPKLFEFDYNKFLQMKGISGIIYAKKEFLIGKDKLDNIDKFRQYLVEKIKTAYSGYNNKYPALALGLLIGDKSLLTKKLYDEFIHSGLVHIIVVSGGNMMFLIIFLSFFLFFIPFYIRLLLILLAIAFYAILAGGDSSVIRAFIMGSLALIALFFGKISDTQRLLGIAFILMLIYNPFYLIYDLGFILSFLAILGILFFNCFQINVNQEDEYSKLSKKLQDLKTSLNLLKDKIKYQNKWTDKIKLSILTFGINFYNNYILPTLGASLFTAPAILLFTKQVNILAFGASLIVVPIVPILMFLNALLIIFPLEIIVKLNIYLMNYIFWVANIFSHNFSIFIKL